MSGKDERRVPDEYPVCPTCGEVPDTWRAVFDGFYNISDGGICFNKNGLMAGTKSAYHKLNASSKFYNMEGLERVHAVKCEGCKVVYSDNIRDLVVKLGKYIFGLETISGEKITTISF